MDNAVILTIVPAPLLTSGLALGKLVSFAIGTNPPTSSTKSIILFDTAAVVATLVSELLQASPDAIVSVESCLKYLASEADVVNTVVSSGVCPEWDELSINNPEDKFDPEIIPVGIELFVFDKIPT